MPIISGGTPAVEKLTNRAFGLSPSFRAYASDTTSAAAASPNYPCTMSDMSPRIAFVASQNPEAQEARVRLSERYGDAGPDKAEIIVALGGDGLMLQTLHRFMTSGKPIYGMHRGTVGFLMNDFREDGLAERLESHVQTDFVAVLEGIRDGLCDAVHAHRLALDAVSLDAFSQCIATEAHNV